MSGAPTRLYIPCKALLLHSPCKADHSLFVRFCQQGFLPYLQGALPSFAMLCEAFTSWRRFLDNGLHNEMAQVMQLYKQSLAAANQWDAATGSLPQLVRERLHQSFAV